MAKSTKLDWRPLDRLKRQLSGFKIQTAREPIVFAFQPKAIQAVRNMKKNHSHATPLRACEVPQKGKKKKAKSVHEKELAEIAREAFWDGVPIGVGWDALNQDDKRIWRSVAQAVLDEAVFRMEAKLFKK